MSSLQGHDVDEAFAALPSASDEAPSMKPLLTVGVPARNAERTIAEALSSILSSSMTRIRVVVADNNSADSTVDIVREFCREDERVVLCRHGEDWGAVRNFQFLLSSSRTPFFSWVAADDLVDPNYFADCIEALESHSSAVMSFGSAKIQYLAGGEPLATYLGTDAFLAGNSLVRLWRVLTRFRAVNLYGVYRTSPAQAAGPLVDILASDALFIRRLALLGPFVGQAKSHYVYRISPEWKSSAQYSADSLSTNTSNRRRGGDSLDLLVGSLRGLGGESGSFVFRVVAGSLVMTSEARRLSRLWVGKAVGRWDPIRTSPKRTLAVFAFVHGLQDVLIWDNSEFLRRIVFPSLRWNPRSS